MTRRFGRRTALRIGATAGMAAMMAGAYRAPSVGRAFTGRRQVSAQELPVLTGRVVAAGLPGVSAICQIGRFLPGGPFHDNAAFAETTREGALLDPARLLVATHSNYGAPMLDPALEPGALLSIDPAGDGLLRIPHDFAADGGQASIFDGRVVLVSAQSPNYRNGLTTPEAATAHLPAISNPLGLSLNNAFGRIWPANAPSGLAGAGNTTILDPDGAPLANAPAKFAGGVFHGDLSGRRPEPLLPGAITTGAVAVTFLGKSPDDGGRAVFAVVGADGSVTQVHSELGVDGLAGAGTMTPLLGAPDWPGRGTAAASSPRLGAILNFEPVRILYITDPLANEVVALTLEDDGRVFTPGEIRRIGSPLFDVPVDLAPVLPETSDTDWASNTTLFAEVDFYVLNRGANTIVRVRQDGSVVAARQVLPEGGTMGRALVNGIGVAPDGSRIWATVSGVLPETGVEGAVLELPAFDAS